METLLKPSSTREQLGVDIDVACDILSNLMSKLDEDNDEQTFIYQQVEMVKKLLNKHLLPFWALPNLSSTNP